MGTEGGQHRNIVLWQYEETEPISKGYSKPLETRAPWEKEISGPWRASQGS